MVNIQNTCFCGKGSIYAGRHFFTITNQFNFLIFPQISSHMLQSKNVFILCCCQNIFIGDTKRIISTRCKDHQRYVRPDKGITTWSRSACLGKAYCYGSHSYITLPATLPQFYVNYLEWNCLAYCRLCRKVGNCVEKCLSVHYIVAAKLSTPFQRFL